MRQKLNCLIISTAAAVVLMPGRSLAQYDAGRWYAKADLGGNITQNADLRDFFGVQSPASKVKFDPGVRVGVGGGYNLTDWFAPEFETGVMENAIHSMTGATDVHDAWFGNVPFLVNAKFQWPNRWGLTPYIGGGVGGSAAFVDIDHISLNGVDVHGNRSDAVFAYQGFIGLKYYFDKRMSLGLEYRYFATESPSWRAHEFFGAAPPADDQMRFGPIRTHALSAAFNFVF